jgi:two-component system OmpR family response regulator
MYEKEHIAVYPLDVYVVTQKGEKELKGGSATLTAKELGLLVLMDGKSNVREITERAKNLTEQEVATLIPKLIREGFASKASIAAEDGLEFSYFFNADEVMPEPPAEAKAQAQKEAETGAPALQREGYYVSIARRASQARRPAVGARLSVLAVEDEPSLLSTLKHLLKLEGFEARIATNRQEVVNALRQVPAPDLVLLDVRLPDANGFDILTRMKQHPALKSIPVIMLTADASRESIMRGLAAGADGYITKPFELANLLTAIRYVLGLA